MKFLSLSENAWLIDAFEEISPVVITGYSGQVFRVEGFTDRNGGSIHLAPWDKSTRVSPVIPFAEASKLAFASVTYTTVDFEDAVEALRNAGFAFNATSDGLEKEATTILFADLIADCGQVFTDKPSLPPWTSEAFDTLVSIEIAEI